MKSKAILLAILAVALVATVSSAYAEKGKTEQELEIGIDLGKQGLNNAVQGSVAGLFLSTIMVIGKHIRNEVGKQPDPKKYGLNVVIGALAAIMVGSIPGLNQLIGAEAAAGLTFGSAFALLFFVDQVIRPIFGNWAKGANAKGGKKE